MWTTQNCECFVAMKKNKIFNCVTIIIPFLIQFLYHSIKYYL